MYALHGLHNTEDPRIFKNAKSKFLVIKTALYSFTRHERGSATNLVSRFNVTPLVSSESRAASGPDWELGAAVECWCLHSLQRHFGSRWAEASWLAC